MGNFLSNECSTGSNESGHFVSWNWISSVSTDESQCGRNVLIYLPLCYVHCSRSFPFVISHIAMSLYNIIHIKCIIVKYCCEYVCSYPVFNQFNTTHRYQHNISPLEDVWMCYSLSVMFHVFPVVKRRENMAAMSKDHRYWHTIGACGKEWDSPAEEENRNI